jgi:hypothetical protein
MSEKLTRLVSELSAEKEAAQREALLLAQRVALLDVLNGLFRAVAHGQCTLEAQQQPLF